MVVQDEGNTKKLKGVDKMLKELLNVKLLLKAGLTVVGIWITLSLAIIALGG